MTIVPREYQKVAIAAALKGLRGKLKRALVVLATGLGKTLTAAFIAKEIRTKRTLFLVHNNFILTHAIDEFRLAFGENVETAIYNGLSKEGAETATIVFATWQTMGRNLTRWAPDHFDLVIVDEAHHSEARTYRPVAKYFTGAKLGITATPDRTDDSDIRNIFGPEVANVNLEESIARGWLPRIEYHVITDESLDEDALQELVREIREARRRFTMAEVNRRLFIRKREEEIARIIDSYKKKAVVFCATIKHAERMNRSLRSSAVFHSKTGRGQQDTWAKNQKALTALRTGFVRRLCAVNAFNEGVNVPDVELVAFCRVTSAITIFRQQLGRGLRPGKDKLVVLDFVGNLERIQLVQAMMEEIAEIHERTISEEERLRERYKHEKFEVSGAGFEFTFSDQIVDLFYVLEHTERDHYPTWQEASRASIALGIRNWPQYKKRHRLDPKLPGSPYAKYPDFPGWFLFLGREERNFYPNWKEASQAAITLGFTNQMAYWEGYKKDPRLPSSPSVTYLDFPGWPKFLGKPGFYRTWQEASEASQALGFRTYSEYSAGYKADPRLPADVRTRRYPDYPGDAVFFGGKAKEFYSTWEEASRAARRLGATCQAEYQKKREKDSKLPSHPQGYYPDFPGWHKFLGKEVKRFYKTWRLAGEAARALNLCTWEKYMAGYKADPLLPSLPSSFYKDYPGWKKFIGKQK